MRVVTLPDDERRHTHCPHRRPVAAGGKLHAERVPERFEVTLRLPLRPAKHRHRTRWTAPRLRSARHALHHDWQRILKNRDGLAGPHGRDEVGHLLGTERRRLHCEEHVKRLGERSGGVDLHDVVLLFEFLDDGLPRSLLAAHHVEAAVKVGVGREHTEPLPLLLGSGAD